MTYPLTYPDAGDARFTGELLEEIGAVLTAHGFPPVDEDTDFAGLRVALHTFLYGPEIDRDDHVVWFRKGKVWSGRVEFVANSDDGLVARIRYDQKPGALLPALNAVVPCRDLTLVPKGRA